ncbi:MAG: LuxR C-terminal-related transcriptional regulator [Rhodospirillales bacterium]|jgi:DNA-binding CsgD family transcriptional regulator|nr:LuxR C-terminal-related transcriptional regulator [Rhodospirillales bacterium]
MAPADRQVGADGKNHSYLLVECASGSVAAVPLVDVSSLGGTDGIDDPAPIATGPDGMSFCLGADGHAKPTPPPVRFDDVRRGVRHLTTRQVEILMALKDGASNKEIAHNLGILESTVKVHLKSIYRLLQVRNRTQAAIVSAQYELARS